MTHRSIHNLLLGLGVASLSLAACADDTTTPSTSNGDEATDTETDSESSSDDEVGTDTDSSDTTDTDTDTESSTETSTDTGETDTGETDTGETDTGETDTGETDTGETGMMPGESMLRVLHLGVDAPNVDVYLDGGDMPAVADLAFQGGTDYLIVPDGPHSVAIVPAGAPPDMAVLVVDVDLAPDTKYSAVAHNYLDALGMLSLVDDDMMIPMGQNRYQVSHTAPDVGQVDLWVLADPPVPLITDLDYGATQQVDAPAGAFGLGIDVDDDMIPDVTFSVPDVGADIFVDVYAVNEAGGVPVFLLAHLPDGSTARIDADVCGDNIVSGTEVCDGTELNGEDCSTQGFDGGTLACAADCSGYDTATCESCGNGVVEGAEVCDGDQSCDSIDPDVFAAGSDATCSGTCDAVDNSACTSGDCCNTGGAGSCEVQAILDCVCALDAFCCNNSWDGICAGSASDDCGAVCP